MFDNVKRGIKNATFLSTAGSISTLIQFLVTTLIARSLGPETYGDWVTIGAFVYFFSVFTIKGLNKVLVREGGRNIDKMNNLLERTLKVRLFFILISVSLCVVSLYFMPYSLQLKFYIAIYSMSLAITSLKSFITNIFHVSEQFSKLARITVFEKISYSITAYAAMYFNLGIKGLLLSSILTSSAFLVLLFYLSRKIIKFRIIISDSFDKKLIKPIFSFSLLGFFTTLVARIDLLMLSVIGSPIEVGIYGVAHKLVSQLGSFRNQVATAFFPIVVKSVADGENVRAKDICWLSFCLIIFILVVSIIVSLFSDKFIIYFFGMDFKESAKIMSLLIFYQVFFWMSLPFTTFLQSTNNEIIALYSNILASILNISLNLYFYDIFGLIGIVYSTLVVYFIGHTLLTLFGLYYLNKKGFLV